MDSIDDYNIFLATTIQYDEEARNIIASFEPQEDGRARIPDSDDPYYEHEFSWKLAQMLAIDALYPSTPDSPPKIDIPKVVEISISGHSLCDVLYELFWNKDHIKETHQVYVQRIVGLRTKLAKCFQKIDSKKIRGKK